MLCCDVKCVLPDVSKDRSAFFRVRHSSLFSLGLLDPGREGKTLLRNLGNCSFDTAWHFTRLDCLATLLREPRISHGCLCSDKHCFVAHSHNYLCITGAKWRRRRLSWGRGRKHGADNWKKPGKLIQMCSYRFLYSRCKDRIWACLKKGKAVPLQAWTGPEGSRKLRFLDFMKTAQDGDKVASLTHRPPLPTGNTPGTHFC